MPEDVQLIGTVRDTDGRSLEIWVDHGTPRIDWAGQRGFFGPVDEAMLLDYIAVAIDTAKDQRAAYAAARADDDVDDGERCNLCGQPSDYSQEGMIFCDDEHAEQYFAGLVRD